MLCLIVWLIKWLLIKLGLAKPSSDGIHCGRPPLQKDTAYPETR
jgi:hypothetical protein